MTDIPNSMHSSRSLSGDGDGAADLLANRIEAAYAKSGNGIGWRFLASPASVLERAEVAFIGLHPGGSVCEKDHPKFCMLAGSAYEVESWAKFPVGQSPLQREARALFQRIGVRPDEVLAGNLIPFRSPDWQNFKGQQEALHFGKQLWREVLQRARPKLVIVMGGIASDAVADILHVKEIRRVSVNWGNVSARKGRFQDGIFIGLPHLSRYRIMTRPKSEAALQELLCGWSGGSSP